MPRTLLVTNDFPPRTGGIQTYLHALAARLPPGELVVFAPAWPGDREFDAAFVHPVHRHRTSLMLPDPQVGAAAAALARSHGARTVWFGAAAPLALLGPGLRRRGGVERVVASTHGHEVGWSMLPGARQALRRIGADADVITTISRYTRARLATAFGPAAALEHLPSGIDARLFAPDPDGRARVRRRHRLGAAPVVVCVSRLVARKGQDVLIRALPRLRAQIPGARLLIVGDGPDGTRLRRLATGTDVVFTGAVPTAELPAHYGAGDAFALPCRTRGGGLDIEGLGIVALEAAACGLPVVLGRSGGAPETVHDGSGQQGRTGHVVDGRDVGAVADALGEILTDPARAASMGAAGRERMLRDWSWPARVQHLRGLLTGAQTFAGDDA